MPTRLRLLLLVAAPPVVCGLIGLMHPHHLTDHTAAEWRAMHIWLIPIFPLLGLGPWLIARRVSRPLGWVAALGGYGFATFYTSLDLLAGVAAGTLQGAGDAAGKAPIYEIARVLGLVGVISLVAACAAAAVAGCTRAPLWAVPGGLLAVTGAALVQPGHIYPGLGTLAMVLLAVGLALLAVAVTVGPPATTTPTTNGAGKTTKGPAIDAGPSAQ
jgi:hypothetical protein